MLATWIGLQLIVFVVVAWLAVTRELAREPKVKPSPDWWNAFVEVN